MKNTKQKCMYCEEQKCCCKNIQRINRFNYSRWASWIKDLIYKPDNTNNF
jgi:hypothetical protein